VATGTTTQWAAGTAFNYIYAPAYEDAVYHNAFLNMLEKKTQQGDTHFRFKAHTAGNTNVELFDESTTTPTAVAQTWVNVAVAMLKFRAPIRYTGASRDANRGAALYPGLNVIEEEFTQGIQDIIDLQSTTFLGTNATAGLQTAIDSNTDYGGITRSAATWFQSTETAVGGAIAHSTFMDLRETMKDNDIGSNLMRIICPWNQETRIQNLSGAPGAANNSMRIVLDQGGGGLQLAAAQGSAKFGQADVVGVGDLTDTVIFGFGDSPIFYVEHRAFDVRETKSGDDDVFQLSVGGSVIVKNPKMHGKLTGCTA
jgi:hypothetical protein